MFARHVRACIVSGFHLLRQVCLCHGESGRGCRGSLELLSYTGRLTARSLDGVPDTLLGDIEMVCPHTERISVVYVYVFRQQGNGAVGRFHGKFQKKETVTGAALFAPADSPGSSSRFPALSASSNFSSRLPSRLRRKRCKTFSHRRARRAHTRPMLTRRVAVRLVPRIG